MSAHHPHYQPHPQAPQHHPQPYYHQAYRDQQQPYQQLTAGPFTSAAPVHAQFLKNLSSYVPSAKAAQLIAAYLSGNASIVLDNPTDASSSAASSSSSSALSVLQSSPPSSFNSGIDDRAPTFGTQDFSQGILNAGGGRLPKDDAAGAGLGEREGGLKPSVKSEQEIRQMKTAYANAQRDQIRRQFTTNYRQQLPSHPIPRPSQSQPSWQSQSSHPPLPRQSSHNPDLPCPSQGESSHSYIPVQNPNFSQHPTPYQSSTQYAHPPYPQPNQFLSQQSYPNLPNSYYPHPFSQRGRRASSQLNNSQPTSFLPLAVPSQNGYGGLSTWQEGPVGGLSSGAGRGFGTSEGNREGALSPFGSGQHQEQIVQGAGMNVGGAPIDSTYSHQTFHNTSYQPSHLPQIIPDLFRPSLPTNTSLDIAASDDKPSSSSRRRTSSSSNTSSTRRFSIDQSHIAVEGGGGGDDRAGGGSAVQGGGEERQHVCLICNRGFARAFNLKAHQATHDPARVKPHKCPFPTCDRAFSRSHDLERHRMGIHGDGPLSAKGAPIPGNYATKANGGRPSSKPAPKPKPKASKAKSRAVRGVSQTTSSSSSSDDLPRSTRRSRGRYTTKLDEDDEDEDDDGDGDYLA